MQKFVGVEYDHEPNDIEIYKSGVDVIISKTETAKVDTQTEEERIVWICDVDRYTLLEYVYFQQNKYNEFQQELTQTQVGLTEVYESLLGGGL